jgi:hypothetical protein
VLVLYQQTGDFFNLLPALLAHIHRKNVGVMTVCGNMKPTDAAAISFS